MPIAFACVFPHLPCARQGGNRPIESNCKMLETIRRSLERINRLFLITVVIPTALAILYFGIFATDLYISESRFVVRSPDKPAASGIGVLLKTAGFSNAGDEIYAAQSFVMSRDALRAVNRSDRFEGAYTRGDISVFDRFNPTGMYGTFEDLYRYYEGKVGIEHDTASSISVLTVRAYSAKEAQQFNQQLLEMAEATVNKLNVRGRQDLIRFAQAEVDGAKESARSAALALSAFRNTAGVVDPEKQAAVQLQMISKLQDELIATKTQLAQLESFTPKNPQIPVLERKRSSLQQEIREQLGLVAGDRKSLAAQTAQYQRLALESQFSDKQLAAALSSLEEARNEARRKQAYVERIVQPNLPDSAREPRRLRGIFATLVLGLVAFGILSMLLAGVKEHQD